MIDSVIVKSHGHNQIDYPYPQAQKKRVSSSALITGHHGGKGSIQPLTLGVTLRPENIPRCPLKKAEPVLCTRGQGPGQQLVDLSSKHTIAHPMYEKQ